MIKKSNITQIVHIIIIDINKNVYSLLTNSLIIYLNFSIKGIFYITKHHNYRYSKFGGTFYEKTI